MDISKYKNIIKNSEIEVEGDLINGDGNTIIKINNTPISTEQSHLSVKKIKEQFQHASHILAGYKNFFEGLPPSSHIPRQETQYLYNWTKQNILGAKRYIST